MACIIKETVTIESIEGAFAQSIINTLGLNTGNWKLTSPSKGIVTIYNKLTQISITLCPLSASDIDALMYDTDYIKICLSGVDITKLFTKKCLNSIMKEALWTVDFI